MWWVTSHMNYVTWCHAPSYVPRLVHECDMTHPYVPWIIDMNHVTWCRAQRDSLLGVTWLTHTCYHPFIRWHDLFICDMTHSRARRDSSLSDEIQEWVMSQKMCVTISHMNTSCHVWRMRMVTHIFCDMSHSRDSFGLRICHFSKVFWNSDYRRYSRSNRLTSEDPEYGLCLYQIFTSNFKPLHSTRRGARTSMCHSFTWDTVPHWFTWDNVPWDNVPPWVAHRLTLMIQICYTCTWVTLWHDLFICVTWESVIARINEVRDMCGFHIGEWHIVSHTYDFDILHI